MSTTTSRAPSTSPFCVYLSAEPFFWDVFGGIPRYTARLGLALAAHVPVRFFVGVEEVLAPDSLSWSQDQDLEQWGRTISRGEHGRSIPPQATASGYIVWGEPHGARFTMK